MDVLYDIRDTNMKINLCYSWLRQSSVRPIITARGEIEHSNTIIKTAFNDAVKHSLMLSAQSTK